MKDKHFKSADPDKRDLTVTCSPYYRRRADTQRALKGHPPNTEKAIDAGTHNTTMAALATWRELEGLSIEELAEKAQVPVPQVRSIEAGSLEAPLVTYLKLAKALRISVEKIVGSSKMRIS
ncbi:hypothetical protein GCM10007874_35870 [Labrys miyagiensis]|uniref:HTH cro/C1-type domain-containing protein n=1 Tax=Labrys miyagiensis TaxID=346912 RepID=A0ABQ6CK67_9HYPH|nr:helix-turn-helix transcriptional regulator [Labrys miyagiensis]GLS20570.1 hypothetical protein GCM10007874_35870 [Labrys miyagiensis]